MSALKRRCGTCRYFQDAGMGGAGWCTHPKRQVSSDVRILVRPAELACRNSWGVDFWESKDSDTSTPDQDHSLPETPDYDIPAAPEASYDDEVTSVVNSEMHRPDQDREENDIIVEQSIRAPGEDEADDDDRFDLLAHGGRDSVNQARERMRRRRQPEWQDETSDDDAGDIEADTPEKRSDFAPNDFVEEEGPSPQNADDHATNEEPSDQDVVISENAPTRSPRSRRLRRSRENPTDPKGETKRKTEAEGSRPEPQATAYAEERGPFDSVPKVSSEIDLSRLLREQPEEPEGTAQNATPSQPAAETNDSYDRALKRAEAIKAAARAEREERQKQQQRPIKPFRQSNLEPEPEATQEPPRDRARISTRDWAPQHRDTSPETSEPESQREPRDEVISSAPEMGTETTDAPDAPPSPRPRHQEDPRRSWWRGMFESRVAEDRRSASATGEMTSSDSASPAAWDVDEYVDQDIEAYLDDDFGRTNAPAARSPEPGHDEDRRMSAEALAAIHEDAPRAGTRRDRATYMPLDLSDEQDMDSYRSRLFQAGSSRRPGEEEPERPERMRESAPPRQERRRARNSPAAPVRQRRPQHEATPMREDIEAEHRAPARRQAKSIDPVDLLEEESDAWYEPEPEPGFDVREIVARRIELLDMTIEIAPEVPRACATCRSYRQSDNSERGWCTNNWAFTHRQMVNATDLACQSTIGCWWLPTDEETWLDTTEPEYAPTPRIDRLVAHLFPLDEAVGR